MLLHGVIILQIGELPFANGVGVYRLLELVPKRAAGDRRVGAGARVPRQPLGEGDMLPDVQGVFALSAAEAAAGNAVGHPDF